MTLALSLGGHVKPVSRFSIGFHSAPPFFGYFHSGELSPPKKNPLFLFFFFCLFFASATFFPGKRFHNRVRSFRHRRGFFHAIRSGTVKMNFQLVLLFWPSYSGTVEQWLPAPSAPSVDRQRADSRTLPPDFDALN